MPKWPLLLFVLLSACRGGVNDPGFVILPDMGASIPYNAYDANMVTGQTLVAPPEGAVAMGAVPFLYGVGKEEAARAGRELTNPLLGQDEVAHKQTLARGQHLFTIFCAVCHGAAGMGDGPIIGAGRFPNPPALTAKRATTIADGEMYHIISRGQGLMPQYALQVAPADRWKVIAYVRTLQSPTPVSAGAPPEPAPQPAVQAEPQSAPQADPTVAPPALPDRGALDQGGVQ